MFDISMTFPETTVTFPKVTYLASYKFAAGYVRRMANHNHWKDRMLKSANGLCYAHVIENGVQSKCNLM